MYRTLKEGKILETAQSLTKRIDERFPGSGLSHVAGEVEGVVRDAVVRAERIRRPDLVVRAGLGVLLAVAVTAVIWHCASQPSARAALNSVLQFLDATKGLAVYLAGLAIFLVTLEWRLKRRRALKAVHELRALAHIIDMHQLTKDPDRLNDPRQPVQVAGRPLNAEAMGRYLHYCTELLAIVSKIGQLYVQDFADAPALAAVDQFENLATGLSQKIWQKIMILDRIRADAGAPCATPGMGAAPVTG